MIKLEKWQSSFRHKQVWLLEMGEKAIFVMQHKLPV
jgi:hypothetical protein